ncbi:hypothetical protein ZWY2020_031291 [Hordeum vulgare]|nr:hypothetical protein ZWY2020_031291 [Hordeum vulgare]
MPRGKAHTWSWAPWSGDPTSTTISRMLGSATHRTSPTLVGNAGLVAALVAITNSGRGLGVHAVNKNTTFSAVPPMFPAAPPPPAATLNIEAVGTDPPDLRKAILPEKACLALN